MNEEIHDFSHWFDPSRNVSKQKYREDSQSSRKNAALLRNIVAPLDVLGVSESSFSTYCTGDGSDASL
jgi:hypothetical protein